MAAVTLVRVTIRLTLQLKRQVWQVVICTVDGTEQSLLGQLPTRFNRKFLSQEAAVRYVTGLVERRLKHHGNAPASAVEVTCAVTVCP